MNIRIIKLFNSIVYGSLYNLYQNHNTTHAIKELQLGLNEPFNYQLCNQCGTMQLLDVPENLGKYYPNEDYYSFNLKLQIKKSQILYENKNRLFTVWQTAHFRSIA